MTLQPTVDVIMLHHAASAWFRVDNGRLGLVSQ
jgi:hypothetical protein